MSQKLRIQNAIVDSVKGSAFPVVKYSGDGNANIETEIIGPAFPGSPNVQVEDITVLPHKPIICNEVSAAYERDLNDGRDDTQRVSQWQFALRLSFDQEVILDRYERDVNENLISIPKDGNLEFVRVRLISKEVEHPVQQNQTTGTRVEYIFEAVEGRV